MQIPLGKTYFSASLWNLGALSSKYQSAFHRTTTLYCCMKEYQASLFPQPRFATAFSSNPWLQYKMKMHDCRGDFL